MKTMSVNKIISGFLLLFLCFLILPSEVTGQKNGDQNQYRFTNNEDSEATDLHIEFERSVTFVTPNPNPNGDVTQQVPSGTFPNGSGSGSSDGQIDLANGFTGNPVASGSSIVLTFGGYGGSSPPSIRRWWWTNDNNLDGNTGQLGATNNPRDGQFDCAMMPSTGDGVIELVMGGELSIFEMPAGLTGEQMAVALGEFVDNSVNWGVTRSVIGSQVNIFSTSYGEVLDDFTVNITPDSTQEVTFKYIPETVPTLTEWGVIILILLVVAIGMVFLYQRKGVLAIAGVSESSTSNPKLFDGRLFAKVFAVVLLIGAAGLVAAYLYFGSITSADPFGIFVSAGIVAYTVHLWLLRKA